MRSGVVVFPRADIAGFGSAPRRAGEGIPGHRLPVVDLLGQPLHLCKVTAGEEDAGALTRERLGGRAADRPGGPMTTAALPSSSTSASLVSGAFACSAAPA
jgi:hypothetical protein